MRIYVRTPDGKRFWLPVPYWALKLGTGRIVEDIIRKSVPLEQRVYIDCVDFSKLHLRIDVLKQYRGLEIVDIKAKDGTLVNIRL